jgi:hypothetical protein
VKAKLVTREELQELVGPGHATGVIRNQCSPEDWRVWNLHVLAQGQPTKPNRAGRRATARLKQKALARRSQARTATPSQTAGPST